MQELRNELDTVLRKKIEDPKADFSDGAKGLIDAVNMLLSDTKRVETTTGGDKKPIDRWGNPRGGYGGGMQVYAGVGSMKHPPQFYKTAFKCKVSVDAKMQSCDLSEHGKQKESVTSLIPR